MIDDPDAKNRVKNALGLEDAKARVAELARWGYTEALVVNDLRIRVERIESKIGSEPAPEVSMKRERTNARAQRCKACEHESTVPFAYCPECGDECGDAVEDQQGRDPDLAGWPLCAVCGKTAREGRHATDFGEGHDYVPLTVAEARPALYAKRRAFRLEPYYSRHVNAMTAEALHSKGAIAAELAHRDQQIARLREALSSARSEITRLGTDGGGFSCAVIDDIDAALGGVKGAGA
jgi:hypothetical protein